MNKMITLVLLSALSCFAQNGAVKLASASAVVPAAVNSAAFRSVPTTASSAVRSFKEWKNEKVQAAIKKVTITKAQIEYKKLNKQFLQRTEVVNAKDAEMDRLEIQLKDDIYALDVAQALGVPEYFAIYLIKQENKTEAYKEAAVKMTDDEVNQLIKAYADSMFPSGNNGRPGIKVGPMAMDKAEVMK